MRKHAKLLSNVNCIIICAVTTIVAIRLESLPLVGRYLKSMQGNLDIRLTNGVMLVILILVTIVSIILAKYDSK